MAAPSDYPSDQMTTYVPSFPYSDKRLYEPPRVQIPPPALDYHHGRPTFRVPSTSFGQISGVYGDPTFLRALTACYDLNMRHTMLSWQYEMRRTAQPILPFLFLGPSSAAKDLDFVRRTGITLLVAIRNSSSVRTRPRFLDPTTFPSSAGISTLTFDFDSPYEFISNLRPIIRAINDHLASSCTRTPQDVSDIKAKALVFCESGNDRSMVLVAAYLMVIFGIGTIPAIHIIQSQRFSVAISDDMKNMLLDLEQIVKAERQVAISQDQPSAMALQRPIKRSSDRMDHQDDDAEMEFQHSGNVDVREGVAPFTDVNG